MTSRPPLAVSQRQPQRSLSGPGLSQRPPHQRTLSQQYLPPSPVRKTESFNDADLGAFGTTPRRGGSKLKLELANDGITHAGFSESPQNLDPLSANKPFTPSRIMPLGDASPLGDLSPHPSRTQTADNESAPLPMPPRLARFAPPPVSRPKPPTVAPAAPVRKDAKPKPFVLEIPADAPRYSNMGKGEPSGYADFKPWDGKGPEDDFSEKAITQGFYDKPPAQVQSEQTSAKATLFPALKHKSGLHTLSTLFTGIMNQRRHSGQITSASTFKPPPRVTLTDTKREVWLRDLANPAISLRRLSRTIPHGIRGRILLDQCLNKNVPTDRAVWLAKCVGANEIRAFKRKGVNGTFVMGGETKWIRDWTIHIEQFVESVVGAFGENEWKIKVQYAIRLATHLYSEYLMERDHYMDWLVSGLENSNQARLPMWLLIIRIYWKDLLRSRRMGRRLVTAALSHHASIYQHPDHDILVFLATQLQSLIGCLLLASPHSFVHPPTWTRYRCGIISSMTGEQDAQRQAIESIDLRNERLVSTQIKSRPAVRGIAVQMLDTTLRKPYSQDLSVTLWKVGEDKASLVATVLEWCMSLYRAGTAKVYVTASILRAWSAFDVDITATILDFLDKDPLQETDRKHLVYHLVSELVRTDHFSVPQYLQWLIARGGLVDPTETQPDGPCLTRLLVEIPTHPLKDSIRSLRATILRKGGFSAEFEANDVASAIRCIQHSLGISLGLDLSLARKPMTQKKLAKRIRLSSRALQAEVGHWLCNGFVASFSQSAQPDKGSVGMSSSQFDSVRALLEAAQDHSMLATALRLLLGSSNAELLASCADTVSLHLHTFAAMGCAVPLFNALLERLKALCETQGIGARPLLASLSRLAPRVPGLEDVAAQLQSDLIRMDRSSAVDASSPLSDNMAMQLQDDETELNEQIEKLASYTSADRPTMERLFQAIINRLQNCWGKADERQKPYCILLTRLRVFDTQHCDTLMRGWVQHIRKLTHRPTMVQIFPLLVSSGCLSLNTLFATAGRDAMQSGSAIGFASIYMQEILQLLMLALVPNQFMTPEDCYRFRIIQEQAKIDHAKELMLLIRGALAEYSISRNLQPPIEQPLDDDKTRAQFLELLRRLILADPKAASQTLSMKNSDAKLSSLIENITTQLLVPEGGGGGQKTFEQVLELANEFTLPFCQVKLSMNLAIDDSNGPDGAERLQSQLGLLSKALDNAIDANNIMWTGMLPSLSPEITHYMKTRAEARFLELMPSLKNSTSFDGINEQDISMAENLLAVIDMIIRGTTTSKSTQVSSVMVDKLVDLWEVLSSTNPEVAPLKHATLTHWLPLLFSYLTLHASPSASAGESAKVVNETRARAVLVLAGLVQELDNSPFPALSQRAFDLALVLVDNLADDARLQCVRAVKDSTSDPRLRYLFSFAPNPAENIMLAHREKPPPGMGINERRAMAFGLGMGMLPERLSPFVIRRWEILSEPTPNVGENDTSLSLHLFEARKLQ